MPNLFRKLLTKCLIPAQVRRLKSSYKHLTDPLMKQLLGMDNKYNQLESFGFFDMSLSNFALPFIQRYCRVILTDGDETQFEHICSLLLKFGKNPIQSLKTLVFYHFSLKNLIDSETLSSIKTLEVAVAYIRSTVSKQTLYLKTRSKKADRLTASSLQKTTSWIRNAFSGSKQKKQFSEFRKSKECRSKPKQKADRSNFESVRTKEKNDIKQVNLNSKEEVLIEKIILPYGTFLLKLVSNKEIESGKKDEQNHLSIIWKRLNSLKYLLKISEQFSLVLRYYSNHYMEVISLMIKMIDGELKSQYEKIDIFMSAQYQEITKIFSIYQANEGCQQTKLLMLQKAVKHLCVVELKQIVEEISELNQKIKNLYLSKQTYPLARQNCLTKPRLIGSACNQFELIYLILNDIRRTTRKSSNSKDKERTKVYQKITKDQLVEDTENYHEKDNNVRNINWNCSIKSILDGSAKVDSLKNIHHRQSRMKNTIKVVRQ